ELRVASSNMWYDNDADGDRPRNDQEYQNAADLLASRGVPNSGNGSFSDPELRGPFQFNSDIVALTEMGDEYQHPYLPSQYSSFEGVARANDSRVWRSMRGIDEDWLRGPIRAGGGSNGIFVASSQWPVATDSSSLMMAPVLLGNDPEGHCAFDTSQPN